MPSFFLTPNHTGSCIDIFHYTDQDCTLCSSQCRVVGSVTWSRCQTAWNPFSSNVRSQHEVFLVNLWWNIIKFIKSLFVFEVDLRIICSKKRNTAKKKEKATTFIPLGGVQTKALGWTVEEDHWKLYIFTWEVQLLKAQKVKLKTFCV